MAQTKKHIVLDLDQTLIAAETPADFAKFSSEIQKQKEHFAENNTVYKMDDDFIVFERPHLQEFLTYIFENFIVSVWTAASKNYAIFIIKNIILKDKDKNGNKYHPRKINHMFVIFYFKIIFIITQ